MRAHHRYGVEPGRPPTILQIVPRLDTGGAELTTIEVTEAVVRAGGRALVATAGGRMSAAIGDRGGTLIPMPLDSKNPLTMLANVRRLVALIKREGVNLVHARSRAPAWSGLLAARGTGRAFVTTYHGAYNETNRTKSLYNGVMARGDIVIANSHYTAGLIRARYGLGQERIRVIHRGVDVRQFDPARVTAKRIAALRQRWQLHTDDRIILQAARLTNWKGQSVLVGAAGLLMLQHKLGHAVVVLAGDAQGRSGYVASLEHLVVKLGLTDHVRLVGHCDDMPAAYALAHVAVVASTEPEAFGRTAAEAQAMGCPIIATSIGAPPETVLAQPRAADDAFTGWLVPPGDISALGQRLAEALALDGLSRDRIAARARTHAVHNFALQPMQRATLAVYDELLGSRLAPSFAGADTVNTSATGSPDKA